jgi:PIN domain nuclease of toxin-antitoxin system
MRVLLDTHIFLWLVTGAPKLPREVVEAVRDPDSEIFLSPVSVWEAVVKYRLGKLSLPGAREVYLPDQRRRHRIKSLPLDETSVTRLGALPSLHRDPFDRILICQALEHDLLLATDDTLVRTYPVKLLPS